MGSRRGDDPKIETQPTMAAGSMAIQPTVASADGGSAPTHIAVASAATVASFDTTGPALRPERMVEVQSALYERLDELARGGLGKITRARDARSGRIVAVKEMIGGGEDAAIRFAREAMITANLQHPAIVPVYEVGRWPSGEPFFAMKLVSGRPLDKVIEGAKDIDARLALISHVLAVADALAYAHGEQVIHRDLKPHNVLCGAFGETVVIDWGLARRLDEADGMASMHRRISAQPGQTYVGAVMGTPSYMPPEQASGKRVDERADVYAIGAILYHLLAGAPPFTGKTLDELLERVKSGPPPRLVDVVPECPPDLAAIVERAMARNADDRYRSAAELATDLRRFTTGQLVLAHQYTAAQRFGRFITKHRGAVLVGTLAFAVLAVVGSYAVINVVRARDEARDSQVRAEAAQARADAERDEVRRRLIAAHSDRARVELQAQHSHAALAFIVAAAEVGGLDPELSFLAARALAHLPTGSLLPAREELHSIEFIPGTRDLVISTKEHRRRWSPATDRVVWELPGISAADMYPLDADRLMSVRDGAMVLLDAATGKEIRAIVGPHRLTGLSGMDPARRWAALSSTKGLELFDVQAGTHVATLPIGAISLPPVVSRGGQRIAVMVPITDVLSKVMIVDRTGRVIHEVCTNCRINDTAGEGFAVAELRPGEPGRARLVDWNGKSTYEITPASIAEIGDTLVSADARIAAVLLADGMIELHEIGKGLRWRQTISDRAYEAAFDGRGRLWVLGAYDGVHVYDTATGIELDRWSGGGVALRISDDGNQAAVGTLGRGVRSWQLVAPSMTPIAPTDTRVRRVLFTDGGRMLAASDDGSIHVYEADQRVRLLAKHGGRITSMQVTRDGSVLSSSRDGTTVIRELATGREIERYPMGPRAELSSDGVHLAIGDVDGKVTLIDRKTKASRVLGTFPREVAYVRWTPDGTKIAALDEAGQTTLWTLDGKVVKEVPPTEVGLDLVFSADGAWFGRIGSSKDEKLLSTVPGVADRNIENDDSLGMTMNIAFSQSDKLVAVSGQGRLRVYDVASGKLVTSVAPGTDLIGLTFSPDGTLLYGGGLDRKIRVWSVPRGVEQTVLGVVGEVYGLQFDSSGKRLAVLTLGAAMLWSLPELTLDLPKLRAIVRCLEPFDPVTGASHPVDVPACNRLGL